MNEKVAKLVGEKGLAANRLGCAFHRAAAAFRRLGAEVEKLKEIRRLCGYESQYLD